MPFNGTKTRTWGSGTAAYGDYFDDEFDRLYANDNDLNTRLAAVESGDSGNVKTTGAQSIAGVKTFSDEPVFSAGIESDGLIQADAGINIASGQALQHNGTPVAGYYSDGTAFFRKRLTGTADGSGNATLAHGIADYTKIQSADPRTKDSGNPRYYEREGAGTRPYDVYWTATDVQVNGAFASQEVVVTIEYIA